MKFIGITIFGGVNITSPPPPLGNKAIFGYGNNGSITSITNLVSNTGVVSSNITGVGTVMRMLAAAGYSST
jgi:hypothetical protein